jgi:hypothetical protein
VNGEAAEWEWEWVRRLSICMSERAKAEACLKCHGRQARHDSCRRELEASTGHPTLTRQPPWRPARLKCPTHGGDGEIALSDYVNMLVVGRSKRDTTVLYDA